MAISRGATAPRWGTVSTPALDGSVTVHLKPGQERRILGGHLWVFSNEIDRVEGEPGLGVRAEVRAAGGRLIGTAFYNPKSLIACRMISGEAVVPDVDFFRRRLADALAFRERVCPGETAYRLCFGESDGLPGLVIDRYGSVLVLQVLSAGIERALPAVQAALEELLAPKGIFLKNDHRARALEGLEAGTSVLAGAVPERVQISEGGLRYWAPLGEGQKTGFYFDQRENRAALRPYF